MNFRRLISAVAAAAVAASAASFSVFAEDEAPAGYVYFMADKTTIGQGFTVQPTKVPFYEGDTGLDVVQRAADVLTEDSGYGAYITAFADEDIDTYVPDPIAEVCPEMTGRNTEGYLGAMDYTAESGWSYFINDEYAQVGITDYVPADGDVVCFEFTVYGYGADLGIDNSSWGGAAALKEQVNKAELIKLCADAADSDIDEYVYTYGMETLAIYESTQEEVDAAVDTLTKALNGELEITTSSEEAADAVEAPVAVEDADEDKGSPATGVEGVAVAFAAVILAGAGVALCRKHN
ncbi:MAG: DUF4430 domain-containing protein [Oscillospiraceae bacterium]